MKILIADDHSVVREGLKGILRDLKFTNLIEEAKDGHEALDKIKSGEFDFAVLDISMPKLSGLDILEALRSLSIKINVLILSIHPQSQYAIRALRLGASGYLSKENAPEELDLAIHKISNGGKYISPSLAEKIVFDKSEENDLLIHERLSEREFQIMCMLAKGQSVKEIAAELFISDKTVSTYRMRLLEKMVMKKNAELTLYAFKNNLIE